MGTIKPLFLQINLYTDILRVLLTLNLNSHIILEVQNFKHKFLLIQVKMH